MTKSKSQEKNSQPRGLLEITNDQVRRTMFLRYVNRAWLIFGIATVASLPFVPNQRDEFIFLAALIFPTYLIIRFLNLSGRTSLAGVILTLSLNFGFYGLFMLLVRELGAAKAFETQSTVWLLMGLGVLFAGAFIDKWAAPVLAAMNTILLIGTRLAIAPKSDPRPSAMVFWWIVALTIWLYEGTLDEAIERSGAEAMERKKAENQILRREHHLSLINQATREILEMKDPGRAYERVVLNLRNLFEAESAFLTRVDEAQDQVILVATSQPTSQPVPPAILAAEDAAVTRSVLRTGKVLVTEDVGHSREATTHFGVTDLYPSHGSVLAIPLVTSDFQFGAIVLGFDAPRRFGTEEIDFIQITSNQITLALRSNQQEYQIQKQLREATTLSNVEHVLSMSERVGVDAVLQLIVDSAKELIPKTKHVVLHLLDEEQQILIPRAVAGLAEGPRSKLKMRLGQGVAGQVLETAETIYIPDIRVDPRFLGQTLPISYRSLLVAPVKSDERCIGTISIHSDHAGAFNPDDTSLLSALGIKATIALENASLLDTTRQDFKEMNTLYHLTRNLVTSLDPDILLKDAVDFLQGIFQYYHVQIFLKDPETGNLLARHGAGIIGEQLGRNGFYLPVGQGIVGHVAETGEPFFTNNVSEVVFYDSNHLLPDTRSEMTLPIKVENKVLGVLDVQEVSARPISFRQMKLMEAIANQLAVALQKATLYTELQTSLNQEKSMRSQLMQSERLAVIGQLLASVSHELNNPLQAIQNALFLLKNEERLSAQGRQDLDVVLSETERMASLIGNLRTTYRPAQADELLDVQLNDIIHDIETLTSTFMRHRGIEFEFEPEPDLPPISGIPDQIRQVVLNLVMNGVDAMQKGGSMMVKTKYLADNDQVLLSVRDTGTGIDLKILPHIFEPYITDKHSGTGLGLTITRDIVLQHHGEINAENVAAGGAVFRIRLPANKQD